VRKPAGRPSRASRRLPAPRAQRAAQLAWPGPWQWRSPSPPPAGSSRSGGWAGWTWGAGRRRRVPHILRVFPRLRRAVADVAVARPRPAGTQRRRRVMVSPVRRVRRSRRSSRGPATGTPTRLGNGP